MPPGDQSSGTKFAELFFRYVLSIIVATIVSFMTFLAMGAAMMSSLGIRNFELLMVAVGFCGVLAGTFCLKKESWSVGSIVLLLLGMLFYNGILIALPFHHPQTWSHKWQQTWPVLLGGAVAVAFFFNRQSLSRALKLRSLKDSTAENSDVTVDETQGPKSNCVRCRAMIDVSARICPKCGWTQP